MARTIECHGELVRFYRERVGLTQLQLATRSGFCERVIRKVEAGDAVRDATLSAIAEALSGDGVRLSADDLSQDPKAVAQAFVRSYLKHTTRGAAMCAHLFDPDVVLVIHSGTAELKFSGEFHGVTGIDQMITQAYSEFEVVSEDFGNWFTNGTRVAALRRQQLRARATPNGPIYDTHILHEYTVTGGRLKRIDNYLDALVYVRLLEFTGDTATTERALRRD